MSIVNVACCTGRGVCVGPITPSGEPYRVCVCHCKFNNRSLHLQWVGRRRTKRSTLIKTATNYGLDGPWFEFRQGKEVCSPKSLDRLWHPPSLLFDRHRRSFLWVKRPGREVDHSPPSYAEVKNEWRRASALHNSLMAWTGTS